MITELATLLGISIVVVVPIAAIKRRKRAARPTQHHHVCEAFTQLPGGGFQCNECGRTTMDLGDMS